MEEQEILKGVSISLHSGAVTGIDGFDKHGHKLNSVVTLMNTAYIGYGQVHQLRADYANIETLTKAQKVLKVSDTGHKKHQSAVPNMLAARGNVDELIKTINETLSKPFQNPQTGLAAEIRSHFKNLSADERRAEMMAAINVGDATTAQAVLGGPSYLSGLSNEDRELYTRSFNEKNSPELSDELKFMEKVAATLERASGILDDEYEKAIGADLKYVQKIREDDARATLAEAAAQ